MAHLDATVIDAEGLRRRVAGLSRAGRQVVAIAGAPGSGKSTLAEALVEAINRDEPERAALLPMDGYHYDDALLNQWGRRARKGAPDTFDAAGFGHMLRRLKTQNEGDVAVPVFDRTLEIARAAARIIPRRATIIVTEGNYLLLQRPPWAALRPLYDLTVMLDVPEEILRQRLVARWQHYQLTPAEIAAKLEDNDLPNGRVVRDESAIPDVCLRNQ